MSTATRAKVKEPVRKTVRKKGATPRSYRPEHLSLEEWQIALRREFGVQQRFKLTPLEVEGDFTCANPQTGKTYRLGIRGLGIGENHCTCPDFRLNTLGTCKHIEFAIAQIRKRPALRKRFEQGVERPYSELFLRFANAERQVVVRRGEDCPEANWSAVAGTLDASGVMSRAELGHFEWVIERLRAGGHDVRIDPELLAYVAQVRDAERLRKRVADLFPRGIRSPLFDKLLKVPLYPYQRQGALFLASVGRALLADDMGLGKTAQSLPPSRCSPGPPASSAC